MGKINIKKDRRSARATTNIGRGQEEGIQEAEESNRIRVGRRREVACESLIRVLLPGRKNMAPLGKPRK